MSRRRTLWGAYGRPVALAAVVVGVGYRAFVQGRPVPVFDQVDFGIHELGHLLATLTPDTVMLLAGSLAQVAFPVVLAVYFLHRSDASAAGLCVGWAGASMWDVSVYIADAPYEALPIIGARHDWAALLGPEKFDALNRAGQIGEVVRFAGFVMAAAGLVLALWPLIATKKLPAPEPVVADEAEDVWERAAALPFFTEGE